LTLNFTTMALDHFDCGISRDQSCEWGKRC
jgi:hypothetical protein